MSISELTARSSGVKRDRPSDAKDRLLEEDDAKHSPAKKRKVEEEKTQEPKLTRRYGDGCVQTVLTQLLQLPDELIELVMLYDYGIDLIVDSDSFYQQHFPSKPPGKQVPKEVAIRMAAACAHKTLTYPAMECGLRGYSLIGIRRYLEVRKVHVQYIIGTTFQALAGLVPIKAQATVVRDRPALVIVVEWGADIQWWCIQNIAELLDLYKQEPSIPSSWE